MQNETSRLVEFEARVVAHHRDRYVVRTNAGDRDAVLAGRFRHVVATVEQLPAVGDWVDVAASSDRDSVAQIVAVRPRRSAFIRKMAGEAAQAQVLAANVDVALITAALPANVSPRRIERLLTLAWESGATPIVVLTKRDLCNDDSLNAAMANARAVAVGVQVLAISTHTGEGLEALEAFLVDGVTAVVLGSSGDGKSTLVNALLGEARQRTLSTRTDGAGRHTTTHRELFDLRGGASIIDTPGLREVQLWSADEGIDATFSTTSRRSPRTVDLAIARTNRSLTARCSTPLPAAHWTMRDSRVGGRSTVSWRISNESWTYPRPRRPSAKRSP